ncbi:MAG: TadE family protein [Candidatus Binatia bacterium]
MRRRPRGQAIVEMGIVLVLLVTLIMGIVEFGRAFMIANMITHATRDAARAAAIVPAGSRNTSGIITNVAAIEGLVKTQLTGTVDTSVLTAKLTQTTTSGIPTVTMTVTGTVPYVFNLPGVGKTFSVNRAVTFRDEGR